MGVEVVSVESGSDQNYLQEGVEAAQAGKVELARRLLRRAAETNADSELVWLWSAKVAPDLVTFERCLERALEINPRNDRVRIWLQEAREQNCSLGRRKLQSGEHWKCPLCDQSFAVKPFKCPRCRSVLSLADLAEIETEAVRRDLVESAIERLGSERVAVTTGDLLAHYRALALAHLNLGQPRKALSPLRLAKKLAPRDIDLTSAYEQVEHQIAVLEQDATPSNLGPDEAGWARRDTVEVDVQKRTQMAEALFGESTEEASAKAESKRPKYDTSDLDVPVRPRTILVVDDSPTIRAVLSTALETKGYRVVLAKDGMETLSKIQGAVPDLVILDVTLPHLDGYKICRVIKENDLTSHVPVVFLTGHDSFVDRVRGRMAGGVEYLTKPVETDALLQVVDRHLPND